MKSYDYLHRNGVEAIDWLRFEAVSRLLAEALSAEKIEVVIGIARGGLLPAATVATMLRLEMFPVRVSRRVADRVVSERPQWKVGLSPEVKGKTVAVIDEIADTGETLAMVANQASKLGSSRVVTAALAAHRWADPMPDHVAFTSDALILFPWDRQVYSAGKWQPHPELAEALRLQNLQSD